MQLTKVMQNCIQEKLKTLTEISCWTLFLIVEVCLFIVLGGTIFTAQRGMFQKVGTMEMRVGLLLVGSILLFTVWNVSLKWIKKCSEKQLTILEIGFLVMIAGIFIWMLQSFHIVPNNDSHSMLDQALFMCRGNENTITEESIYHNYFSKYSNNYFLTIVFVYYFQLMQWIGITDIYMPVYILNALAIYIGIVLAWKIARVSFGKKAAVMLLMFCAFHPVYYLKVFWVYSNTLSVPFLLGLFYLGICIYKEKDFRKKLPLVVLTGVMAVIGYYIRPTSVFPGIALLAGFVLYIGKQIYKKNMTRRIFAKWMFCVLVGALTIAGTVVQVQRSCSNYFGSVEDGNYPISHWLMMGSHDKGRYNKADDVFTQSLESQEEKKEATLQETILNYQELGVAGTANLMVVKLCSVWSDGYFSLDTRMSQNTQYNPLYSWLVGENKDCFYLYCQCYWTTMIVMVLLSVIQQRRSRGKDRIAFLLTVTLFGGFLFYCIWEVKQDYALPFLLIWLLLAQNGIHNMQKNWSRMIKEKISWNASSSRRKRLLGALGVVMGSFFLVIAVMQQKSYATTTHKEYSIRCYGGSWMQDIPLEEGEQLVQGFYPEGSFNCLDLYVREEDVSSEDRYRVLLQDHKGKNIYTTTFTNHDITRNNLVILEVPLCQSNKEQGYRLVLKKETKGPMYVRARRGMCLDSYKGELAVQGKEMNIDIYLSVSQRR